MRFDSVLTLVATLPNPPLEFKQIQRVGEAMRAAGALTALPDWLCADVAADIGFTGLEPDMAADLARRTLCGHAVDAVAQPFASRRKYLLVADMDSTIIEQECLDELAGEAGIKDEIAAITEAAMRGELDFEGALRARVARLSGLSLSALERARDRLTLTPGAVDLVQTMRKNGAECHLVSGGFRYFTRHIAGLVGFNSDRSNEFGVEGDVLSGEVIDPILGKEAKLQTLNELTEAMGLRNAETLAVGDGANDLPMLQAAGLGVAFHAKPKVAAETRAIVSHSDLTALLYLQGYRADEIYSRG